MQFFIWAGEQGGCGAQALIRAAASAGPVSPTLVTPNLLADWSCGLGKVVALWDADTDWMDAVQPGDLCLLLEQEDRLIRSLRRKKARVMGFSSGAAAARKQTIRQLKSCDAVIVPDARSFDRLTHCGVRRVFLWMPETDRGQL